MTKLLWLLTALGSIIGAFVVLVGVAGANGAPQEAAAAAIGISFAVIPYCLARASAELGAKPAERSPRVEQTPARPPDPLNASRPEPQ